MLDALIPISPQDNIENKQAEISEKPYMLKKNWHELSISSCSKNLFAEGVQRFQAINLLLLFGWMRGRMFRPDAKNGWRCIRHKSGCTANG